MSRSDQAQAIADGQPIAVEPGVWLSRVRARLDRLATRWAERRQAVRGLRQLYLCTDRELWDMGFSRADFPAIIRGTFRRD
jgi:uncharacterized protein YjiS (DUF1127 family)